MRASFFEESVIEKPRTGTEVQRVYYNNSTESQHFREKGPYRLNTQYAKFQMDSVKWHSLDAEK